MQKIVGYEVTVHLRGGDSFGVVFDEEKEALKFVRNMFQNVTETLKSKGPGAFIAHPKYAWVIKAIEVSGFSVSQIAQDPFQKLAEKQIDDIECADWWKDKPNSGDNNYA